MIMAKVDQEEALGSDGVGGGVPFMLKKVLVCKNIKT